MSEISVKENGLKELMRDVHTISQKSFVRSIMKFTAKNAEQRAKSLCPVASAEYSHAGRLMRSIHSTYDDDSYTVFTDDSAPYASFNEYGSLTTPVVSGQLVSAVTSGFRPFVRPAMVDANKDVEEELNKKIFVELGY